MGATYDKVEPHIGIVRAPLAADLTVPAGGEFGPVACSIDANGRAVVGTQGQSGYAGVFVKNLPVRPAGRFSAAANINHWMGARAGDIIDIMLQGQIVDTTFNAGKTIWAVPATGVLTETATAGNIRVGYTVEAGRLIVDGRGGVAP